jgi:hypothetical protein
MPNGVTRLDHRAVQQFRNRMRSFMLTGTVYNYRAINKKLMETKSPSDASAVKLSDGRITESINEAVNFH